MSDTSRHLADARAARGALEDLLDREAPGLRPGLPDGFLDRAERYVALLLEANARLNLTRLTGPDDVARLHLLDALAALPILDERPVTSVVDIGSGGGVPGIVLALARPEIGVVLVDSVGKKADALRAFVQALRLERVEVRAERAEDLGRGTARESADVVTARACAALPVLAEYALPLIRTGGRLLAWKGRIETAELRAGTRAAARLGGAEPAVRGSGIGALGDHSFVLVEKTGPTPSRYPRRAGEPARRPLGD